MKFTVDQSELKQAIDKVFKAISRKPSRPVLGNILLVVESGLLTLVGFNEKLAIQCDIPVDHERPGSFTLPGELFSNLLARMPGGMIAVELDKHTVTLDTLAGSYQIQGLPDTDYPSLPQVSGEPVTLDGDALLAGIRGTLYAASTEETKQVLCGVHITIPGDKIEMAATDGHRLAVVEIDQCDQPPTSIDHTIPSDALHELERMLATGPGSLVKVLVDEAQIRFEGANQVIISRLLEGQYPNYRQLMPKAFSRNATIERKPFITGLERIAVLAALRNDLVDISLSQGKVQIRAEASEVGSGHETLPCDMDGADVDICFNIKYLLQALKNLDASHIDLKANAPTSPVILTPVGSSRATSLIMPVQKRS